MKYRKILLIASALVLLGTAGCGKKETTSKEEPKETVQEEAQEDKSQSVEGAEVKQEEIPANQNLLTGLADL